MRDDAVGAAFPLVKPEEDEEDGTGDEWPKDVGVAPRESAAGPVEAQEKEGRAGSHEERADGVARPDELAPAKAWVVGGRGPVETEQAEGRHPVERGLHPEDVSLREMRNINSFGGISYPSRRVDVGTVEYMSIL